MGVTNFPHGVSSMGVPLPGLTGGSVYFVDLRNGSDSNDGESTERPFRTVGTALDACVNNKGDIIYVMAPGGSGGSVEITSTIHINKSGIAIVGLPSTDSVQGGVPGIDTSNLTAISIDAGVSKVSIQNLRIHLNRTGYGISLGEVGSAAQTQIHLKNISIVGSDPAGGNIGVYIAGTVRRSVFEDISIYSDGSGVTKGFSGNGQSTTAGNLYKNIYVQGAMSWGIELVNGTHDVIENPIIGGAVSNGIWVRGSANLIAGGYNAASTPTDLATSCVTRGHNIT